MSKKPTPYYVLREDGSVGGIGRKVVAKGAKPGDVLAGRKVSDFEPDGRIIFTARPRAVTPAAPTLSASLKRASVAHAEERSGKVKRSREMGFRPSADEIRKCIEMRRAKVGWAKIEYELWPDRGPDRGIRAYLIVKEHEPELIRPTPRAKRS